VRDLRQRRPAMRACRLVSHGGRSWNFHETHVKRVRYTCIFKRSVAAAVDEDQPNALRVGLEFIRVQNSREVEYAGQLQALRDFAHSLGVPVETAAATYDREVRALRSGAKVDRFVGVIAQKRAKDAIRHVASIERRG
jgi:hypothetical protein